MTHDMTTDIVSMALRMIPTQTHLSLLFSHGLLVRQACHAPGSSHRVLVLCRSFRTNTQHTALNTEHTIHNRLHTTHNTERRTQNTEHRTRNTEHRTQITDHGTRNTHTHTNTKQASSPTISADVCEVDGEGPGPVCRTTPRCHCSGIEPHSSAGAPKRPMPSPSKRPCGCIAS